MKDFSNVFEKSLQDILFYDPEHSVEHIIKTVFEALLGLERQEFLDSSEVKNKGNGYYERVVRCLNKYLNIKIPRDRLGQFKPLVLEFLKHQDVQVQELAFQLYVKGLSTRDIEDVIGNFFGKKLSASSVSNITKEFQVIREAWQSKPLEAEYNFLFIDALWIPVRRDVVEKEAFYIVLGLKPDLTREVLGVYNIPTESAEGWKEVIQDLKKRGLKRTLMIVADGIKSLETVVREELPHTRLQKCLLHKVRNILLKARSSHKEELAQDFKQVFQLENPSYTLNEGRKNLETFLRKWKKAYPRLRNKFEQEHIQHYFAYLEFPYQIHRMIYTTNWIERLNKTIRKTQRIRNSFPTPDSAMNLIVACLMETESNVYKYKVTSFIPVKNKLREMLLQTHKT